MPEFDDKRWAQLLASYVDESMTPEDRSEFRQLIKQRPELVEELAAQVTMDESLSQYENVERSAEAFITGWEERLTAEADSDAFVSTVLRSAEPEREAGPSRLLQVIVLSAAIAATAVFAFSWLFPPREVVRTELVEAPPENAPARPLEEMQSNGIAVVAELHGDALWNQIAVTEGESLAPGELLLSQGIAVIEFYRGAQVTVAGPAILKLVDEQRIICQSGRVRAVVPEVAIGFTVATPDSEVVDLGTEFGVEVDPNGQTQIHVFDGEVEAYDDKRSPDSKRLMTAGQGLTMDNGAIVKPMSANPSRFQQLLNIDAVKAAADQRQYERWQDNRVRLLSDSRLIAYYDFEKTSDNERTLQNYGKEEIATTGAIVGARWVDGPWHGKSALTFKRPGDRVRVRINGDYEQLTLAAWVRIDGLDRLHSSLLLTDKYDPGEVHWQIHDTGRLLVGHRESEEKRTNNWSDTFFSLQKMGQWLHLATVIDTLNGTVQHYVDGELITETPLATEGPLRFGSATIGNWSRPVEKSLNRVRNLNGALAELVVFNGALSEDQIRILALR